jgi:endonuclease YncB( thermonuclease family)
MPNCDCHAPLASFLKIIVGLLVAFLLSPPFSIAGQLRVTDVYSGDLLTGEENGVEFAVRLAGIEAPDTTGYSSGVNQRYGEQSRKYLSSLVLNRRVAIQVYGYDAYNHVLGVVYLNGRDINHEMVRAGLAGVRRSMHPHNLDLSPYWQAENEAREAKRGIWSHRGTTMGRDGGRFDAEQETPRPQVPPWQQGMSPKEYEQRHQRSNPLPPWKMQ